MGMSAATATLISAGIEAAAAGGTAAYNGIGASKRQKRAQRYYERNVADQRKYNEDYTRKMLHDSVGLEYQGMVDAGINPMLSNGSDYSNVAVSPSDASIQAPQPEFNPLDFHSMAAPIQQALLNQAQVNNLNAQTDKLEKELPQVEAMTEFYKSQKHLTDEQAGSIAIQNRKTQEEINQLLETQQYTRTQKRALQQQIDDVVPKQLEALGVQMNVNLKDIDLKSSQIYLNNERAKSEYSRRQVNFAECRYLEELAQKTMYEALTGQISYTIAAQTFSSVVEKVLQENRTATKQSVKDEALTINAKDYPTYFQCMQWYNEVVSGLLRPIGEVLGVAQKVIK